MPRNHYCPPPPKKNMKVKNKGITVTHLYVDHRKSIYFSFNLKYKICLPPPPPHHHSHTSAYDVTFPCVDTFYSTTFVYLKIKFTTLPSATQTHSDFNCHVPRQCQFHESWTEMRKRSVPAKWQKGHIVQDTQTCHVAEKGRSQFSATEAFKNTATVTC